MDSGTTTHLRARRCDTQDQDATDDTRGGGDLPECPRSLVHGIGFTDGLPDPLVRALHACGFSRIRIAAGLSPAAEGGSRPAELRLVAIESASPSKADPACSEPTPRPWFAVCFGADEALTLRALSAGAEGVLYLEDGQDDLERALHAVAAGTPALTLTAARALIRHARDVRSLCSGGRVGSSSAAPRSSERDENPATPPVAVRLTAREREIILLADQGCTFTQAARLMGVQVSTVYTHVRRLYDKLSVNSLPQALHEARRAGLL